ncbi:MAG: hypothetical protein PS018_11475 [bacterium]|nr:hypothetical protein [bacterium]
MAFDEQAPLTNVVPDDTDLPAMEQDGSPKPDETPETEDADQALKAHVTKIIKTIKADKAFHAKAFKRMRRDMFVAMYGREETWSETNYKANIAGRHVKQKTATLYAKNPKATAKRAERLDFAVWDEDPQSIVLAMQAMQQNAMAEAAHMQAQQTVVAAAASVPQDPFVTSGLLGHNGGPPLDDPIMQPYQPSPEAVAANELLTDFQQGMERRKQIDKIGKTLEILYAKALREQKPVDFKTAAKQLVRRTCTTGVGYVELGFQREYGPRPGLSDHLADSKVRLDHLARLSEDVASGEIESTDAEMAELQASIASLEAEPEILVREGLIFDWPRSTKVIPDMLTKTLVGFIGARHITVEYEYTLGEVRELFDGVDLKDCAKFNAEGKETANIAGETFDEDGQHSSVKPGEGLVRVWKHYDKPSGLVYYVAEGYHKWLREPAPPDVFVEDFWPVYALTFNEVENEDDLYPPSDVYLLRDMQNEHNRSRQGKREHREAARPRWVFPNGAIEEEDQERLKKMKPFDVIGLNVDPATKMADVFQSMPVPGVDPNLYDTNETFADAQIVVGAQEAQLGGTSNSSATEVAISAGTTNTADGSSIDDLDGFMTIVARAAGQILLREMSEETVKAQAGPGAVWPHLSLADIAGEVFLEIEAGSMGKPNQAFEIKNWKEMLPLLIQMGSIKPLWLARETLRRLDDKMDLTDAVAEGIPSIASMNQTAQPSAAGAVNDPAAQGGEGKNNAAKGPSEVQPGSEAPLGNNRV